MGLQVFARGIHQHAQCAVSREGRGGMEGKELRENKREGMMNVRFSGCNKQKSFSPEAGLVLLVAAISALSGGEDGESEFSLFCCYR